MFKIRCDEKQMNELVSALRRVERGLPSAMKRALNRTADGARTIATRELGAVTTAHAKDIRDALKVDKASQTRLQAVLHIGNEKIPLVAFRARQTRGGASYQIWSSGGREKFRHSFLARMRSGYTGVFMRKELGDGKFAGRFPLTQLVGPSPATLAQRTPGILSRIVDPSVERLKRELAHELDWLMRKQGVVPDE